MSGAVGHGGRPAALVTGGRRGIGRAIAWALAERGFDLVIADLEQDAEARVTLHGLAERGADARFVAADIAEIARHDGLVEAVYDAFGRLDCLVNNAGLATLALGDLLELAPQSYDRLFAVNTRGTFFLTQAAARRMLRDTPPGTPRSITFVTSSNARLVAPNRGDYCMSKAAAAMAAQLFAARLGEAGIAVHEIRPGLIDTAMTARARERYDRLVTEGATPIRRWGQPEDVGRAVAALAAGDIPFTTGAAFAIDGGMHLHRV
ncbi:3-ketoacyl-ACP reductase [Roseomonas sp. OT10]|uniref:3-ketoacyl-ACP reductase n=1 Tax=Roseomonas cutis TaxID=2897332 RepID=UPI001E4A5695|nr:3-ketoacyl-ACP reductase [Roseomonas sp. OT10]UFN47152.1 3-ketoacyl-ACP reductase [Roseomonas sp. OT10]